MKLIGDLKEKVEKTSSLAEAKQEIANAGMELTDEEIEIVAGGSRRKPKNTGNQQPQQPAVDQDAYNEACRIVDELLGNINILLPTEVQQNAWDQLRTGVYNGISLNDIAKNKRPDLF